MSRLKATGHLPVRKKTPLLQYRVCTRLHPLHTWDSSQMASNPTFVRILVIDDDDSVRFLLRQTLARAGHDVSEARNGNEAHQVFKEKPTQLVITDVLMPEKDGIEAIREFRENNPEVKIIAISGGGRIDPKMCLMMAKHVGADRVLSKPFEAEALLSMVRELFPPASGTA
jgi:DNA-binding response OmpR family regulator